jgi:hypothetical protein
LKSEEYISLALGWFFFMQAARLLGLTSAPVKSGHGTLARGTIPMKCDSIRPRLLITNWRHPIKKCSGVMQTLCDLRSQSSQERPERVRYRTDIPARMAQLQNMLDFPPAPKLNSEGRLDLAKAAQSELRGEDVFFGKAIANTQ